MREIINLISSLAIIAFLSACGGGGGGSSTAAPQVESISVTTDNNTVPLGLGINLTVTAHFDNNTTKDVTSESTYLSSDTNVLTHDANGSYASVGVGSSILTAQFLGYEKNTTITVTDAELTALGVTSQVDAFAKGKTTQLTATGTYTDSSTVNLTNSVNWNSDDTSVVTIDSAGVASALQVGSANIVASLSGITSNSKHLTVNVAELDSITITPSTSEIIEAQTTSFTAAGTYSDSTQSDITNSVLWSSNDTSIASIDNSGTATGIAPGSVTITATLDSISGTAILDVSAASLTSISLSLPSNVEEGWTGTLSAIGSYDNNTTKDISTLATWTSSDHSIATVSGNIITGESNGTVQMTASLNAIEASDSINIVPEDWCSHMSMMGGSSSSSIFNNYVQAVSEKYFYLLNGSKSTSTALQVKLIWALDGNEVLFYSQALTDDLTPEQGVGYRFTLGADRYNPIVGYSIEDLNTGDTCALGLYWISNTEYR